jgi:hypothetical protein
MASLGDQQPKSAAISTKFAEFCNEISLLELAHLSIEILTWR